MFIDEARIHVEGGRGGDGCVSFRKEKYRPHGGPDGGDGGAGGDVVLEATEHRSTLGELHRRRHHRAKNGSRGGSQNKTGARGADLVISVPPGTAVKASGGALIADLVGPGQRFVAAPGGIGGRGNSSLAGKAGPLPRFAERGERGRALTLDLELKLVADAAVVGFPNAGKSSLVSRISRARPRIADYPFTTTEPNLGVVAGEEFDYVITDVPGLVEGAHRGKGMGTAFLRHIERASVIVYMVDMSPMSGREPVDDLVMLEKELALFNPRLVERRRIVAANKMDVGPEESAVAELRRECVARGLELFCISVARGDNMGPFMGALGGMVEEARCSGAVTGRGVEYVAGEASDLLVARREGGRFIVEGRRVERMVNMTDWGNDEAVAHLARRLRAAGVEELLAGHGAVEGCEVEIAGRVFEYLPEGGALPGGEPGPAGTRGTAAGNPEGGDAV